MASLGQAAGKTDMHEERAYKMDLMAVKGPVEGNKVQKS